jgi:hypothetical protein
LHLLSLLLRFYVSYQPENTRLTDQKRLEKVQELQDKKIKETLEVGFFLKKYGLDSSLLSTTMLCVKESLSTSLA